MPKKTVVRRFAQQANELKEAVAGVDSTANLSIVREDENVYGLVLTLQNNVAGAKFEYSPREGAGWHVVIGQLVEGRFPPHPIDIKEDTRLLRYDIRDLATERIELIPTLAKKIRAQESLSASEVVFIVDHCAKDIFRGDFSVFPALRIRVMERLAEFNRRVDK